jgi:hypothetical protein
MLRMSGAIQKSKVLYWIMCSSVSVSVDKHSSCFNKSSVTCHSVKERTMVLSNRLSVQRIVCECYLLGKMLIIAIKKM